MIVEVTGAGSGNAGSELMLAAIVQRLSVTMPTTKLAIDTKHGQYERRVHYGFRQCLRTKRLGRRGLLLRWLMTPAYQDAFGLVGEDRIDAVLDASGFAMGDQFIDWVEYRANEIEASKKQGKRVVLLPQSFGPFENRQVRAAAKRMLASADLIYARDSESFAHVSSIAGNHPALRQAPDFTNLVSSRKSLNPPGVKPVALVPNHMMLRTFGEAQRDAYIGFMASAADVVKQAGADPFVLLHEKRHDRELAQELAERAGNLTCIDIVDPLEIKGLIGDCWMLIGSRFHSLVNALSQAVPAIGTSWSHKYQKLFADYDSRRWRVDPWQETEASLEIVDTVVRNRQREHERLKPYCDRLKMASEAMWLEVEAFLRDGTLPDPGRDNGSG